MRLAGAVSSAILLPFGRTTTLWIQAWRLFDEAAWHDEALDGGKRLEQHGRSLFAIVNLSMFQRDDKSDVATNGVDDIFLKVVACILDVKTLSTKLSPDA